MSDLYTVSRRNCCLAFLFFDLFVQFSVPLILSVFFHMLVSCSWKDCLFALLALHCLLFPLSIFHFVCFLYLLYCSSKWGGTLLRRWLCVVDGAPNFLSFLALASLVALHSMFQFVACAPVPLCLLFYSLVSVWVISYCCSRLPFLTGFPLIQLGYDLSFSYSVSLPFQYFVFLPCFSF